MKTILILLILILATACSSMFAPSSKIIKQIPVIQAGDNNTPASNDYILAIPAGKPFPVQLQIDSALLKKNTHIETKIVLNRELFIYKLWASYDGKHWKKLKDLFGVNLTTDINPKRGIVNINLEQYKKAGF